MEQTTETIVHYCDFCRVAMAPGDYHTLSDGLEQCKKCFSTAIDTIEEEEQFHETMVVIRDRMMNDFDITIKLKRLYLMFNSATFIARVLQKKFVPTPNFDPRIVGLATRRFFNLIQIILLERGTPFRSAIVNTIHELVHIWQYQNWPTSRGSRIYGRDYSIVVEGMAMWGEIQLLLLSSNENMVETGKKIIVSTLHREDAYGWGLYNFLLRYPFVENIEDLQTTPFNTKLWPEKNPIWPIKEPLYKPKAEAMIRELCVKVEK
jgi:hypothetical protein